MKEAINRFGDWLVVHRKNPLVRLLAGIILMIITPIYKLREYTMREVVVYVQYAHIQTKKIPYTINGYITMRGISHSFSDVPWEKIDELIQELEAEDKPLVLHVEHNSWFQEIHLSRWARRTLAEKLHHLKKGEEKRMRMEQIWGNSA